MQLPVAKGNGTSGRRKPSKRATGSPAPSMAAPGDLSGSRPRAASCDASSRPTRLQPLPVCRPTAREGHVTLAGPVT